MSDTSNDLAITNSTTVDFVVIDSVVSSSDSANSQSLAPVLKLLQTTTGANSIPAGTTASVTLNDTYIDPTTGQPEPSTVYQLIFSTTDWLTPVAVQGVVQDPISGQYAPVTILDTARQAMQSAMQFVITITVYPTSDLAKNYNNAVSASANNADQSQSADDITQGVDNFFQGTKGFSNVTFDMVAAIDSYFNSFPFVWARNQSNMIYYLYSSDGSKPPQYVGQLNMQRSSSGIPNVADSNGGYKIDFIDASGKDTSLTYVQGQFVDNPNADIPGICLQGTFTLKSRLTGQASDNQVMTILSGSIDGITVLGLDTQQQQQNSSQRGYWQTLFDPQGAQEIMNSILTLSGLLMTLHMVVAGLRSLPGKIRQFVSGKKPMTLEEALKKYTAEMRTGVQQEIQKAVKDVTANKQTAPATVEEAEIRIQDEMTNIANNGQRSLIKQTLEQQSEIIQKTAESAPPTPELQKAASELRQTNNALNGATREELPTVLEAQDTQVTGIRQLISKAVAKVSKLLSTQVKEQIANNTANSEKIEEDRQAIDETDGQDIKDGTIDDTFELPEFLDI